MTPQEAAQRLLGMAGAAVEPVEGGGNNRVFRVRTGMGEAALKQYLTDATDGRDRLGHEWAALTLLARHLPGRAPKPLAVDPERGWAAFDWVEGAPAGAIDRDVDSVVAFVHELQLLGAHPDAQALPPAAEACLSLADLISQIERRIRRLGAVNSERLRLFLADAFEPLFRDASRLAREHYARAALDPDRPLAPHLRILSPSDFGFHNAKRREDGALIFLDFEYFGWDDPVKLVADFLTHPAMRLSAVQCRRFEAGMTDCFRHDAGYKSRLLAFNPLIGLRWSLIVLNEFLPEGWARRQTAGALSPDARERRLQEQLEKAQSLYRLSMDRYLAARRE
jgi:hypothetical protein